MFHRSWYGIGSSRRVVLLALMAVALAHAVAVWGYGGLFWGDHGRWLHEVERFAAGESPYRDFHWAFPPFSLWLVGGVARFTGTDFLQVSALMLVVYAVIAVLAFAWFRRVIGGGVALVVPCFLLAVAYAGRGGAPLPMGLYTPAAPIGFALLLGALLVLLALLRSPRVRLGAWLGLLCGLCIVTKQDFWLPAAYLLAIGGVRLWSAGARSGAAWALGMCVSVVLAAAFVVAARSGWGVLPGIPGGFGHVAEFGGRGVPTWERVTVDLVALGLLGTAVALLLEVAGRPGRRVLATAVVLTLVAAAIHVSMTLRVGADLIARGPGRFVGVTEEALWYHIERGNSLVRPALGFLRARLRDHLLPVLGPLVLLAGVVLFRRRLWGGRGAPAHVSILVGLLILARAKRGFEGADWYHFLLEPPVYAAALASLPGLGTGARKRAAFVSAFIGLMILGAFAYRDEAAGPLTRRGTREWVRTARGPVKLAADQAADLEAIRRELERRDPTGRRPLLAFAYTGGFNYFLDRRNPTPLTQGFRLTSADAASVVASVLSQEPRPFLLDNPFFGAGVPARRPSLSTWEATLIENPYQRYGRPFWNRLLASCRLVARLPDGGSAPFELYDCSR